MIGVLLSEKEYASLKKRDAECGYRSLPNYEEKMALLTEATNLGIVIPLSKENYLGSSLDYLKSIFDLLRTSRVSAYHKSSNKKHWLATHPEAFIEYAESQREGGAK